MALQNKRIVDLPERSTLNADDYTVIDGQTGSTGKYKLSTLQEDVTGAKQNITQLTQTVTAQGQQISTNTQDITDLKEDLKTDLTKTNDDLKDFYTFNRVHYNTEWVLGALDNSGGVYSNNYKYRIATNDVQHNVENLIVKWIDPAFMIVLKTFTDSTASTVDESVSISPARCPYLIPNGSYFRMSIRRITENTSEVANIDAFVSKVAIESYFDDYLDGVNAKTAAYYYDSDYTAASLKIEGTIATSQSYRLSPWIKVNAGDVIKYRLMASPSNNVFALCSTKIYKTNTIVYALQGIGDSGYESQYLTGEYTVPSDGFVRYCFNVDHCTDGYFYIKNALQTESAVRIAKLEDDVYKPIPTYWESAISTAESRYETLAKSMSDNVVSFPFITDIHWGSNAKQSPRLLRRLCDDLCMTQIVCGGDVETGHETTADASTAIERDFFREIDADVVTTLGNHDNNSDQNTDAEKIIADGTLYNTFFRKWEQHAICDGIHNSYFDFPSHKLRIVQLDSGTPIWYKGEGYTTTYNTQQMEDSCDWAYEKIAELSSDWKVIVLTHILWNSAIAGKTPMLNAFVTDKIKTRILDKDYSAEIIAMIAGHLHRDIDGTLQSTDTTTSVLLIGTTTDNYNMSTRYGGPTMTKGTATEQAFDLFQIDLDNRDIYATRIGAGDNRHWTY